MNHLQVDGIPLLRKGGGEAWHSVKGYTVQTSSSSRADWVDFVTRVRLQTPPGLPLTGEENGSPPVKGELEGICSLLFCSNMSLTECNEGRGDLQLLHMVRKIKSPSVPILQRGRHQQGASQVLLRIVQRHVCH
jgi:hypothetical protein